MYTYIHQLSEPYHFCGILITIKRKATKHAVTTSRKDITMDILNNCNI